MWIRRNKGSLRTKNEAQKPCRLENHWRRILNYSNVCEGSRGKWWRILNYSNTCEGSRGKQGESTWLLILEMDSQRKGNQRKG